MNHPNPKRRSFLASLLSQRCPRCREGRLYSNPNPYNLRDIGNMPPACPVCGQDYVIEPGFFFGATYISYAFNVAWVLPTFFLLHFGFNVSFNHYIIFMFSSLVVLVPLFFRISRSVWIHLFVKYDPARASS
jgi:uncharacterized protein (DUF983 family)